MPLPTPGQFLAALAADPQAAAAFDAATQRERPGTTRREAVEACHQLATNTLAQIAANRQKLAVARAKITALEAAKSRLGRHSDPSPALPRSPISRVTLAALTPARRMAYFKNGGKLSN